MNWAIKASLEFRRLGSEAVALDAESGRFFRLSPAAADCLCAIAAGRPLHHQEPGLSALLDLGLIMPVGSVERDLPHLPTEAHVLEYQAFTVYASHCGGYATAPTCNGDTNCKWNAGACGPNAGHPANK